jgi:PPOX class probable F420-dependent enzyme
MDERALKFLEDNHAATMVTLRADGGPHVARVGVGLVDGKLWSSGTQDRLRTKHLRRDPRASFLVFGSKNAWQWLGLDGRVVIHEDDAPAKNLALYRVLAGEPDDMDQYLQAMVDERRLIYELEVERTYGTF